MDIQDNFFSNIKFVGLQYSLNLLHIFYYTKYQIYSFFDKHVEALYSRTLAVVACTWHARER